MTGRRRLHVSLEARSSPQEKRFGYPKLASPKPNWRQNFFKHARLHGTCPPLCKTIRDVTRLPPGHAFGGLLGGRALTPRRPNRRPPGQGLMTVPILRLPRKQDEPPASPLAGGPKGWMLGHGPAPGGPRHIARPNPRTYVRIGPRPGQEVHLVGRPSRKGSFPRSLRPHLAWETAGQV